jgi:NAD(P)-dependent dehydrogenase (short-subunit alcohol dehydrogenase family)
VPGRDDVQCDVTDTAALARAAGEFADPHGLGIWVNNAGRYPHTGPIETVSDDFLAEVFDLNVRAQFAACREAARLMPRGGSIINGLDHRVPRREGHERLRDVEGGRRRHDPCHGR